jgi:hypothetical protein
MESLVFMLDKTLRRSPPRVNGEMTTRVRASPATQINAPHPLPFRGFGFDTTRPAPYTIDMMKRLTVCILGVLCAASARGAYDFTRYRVILDRQPFGQPPPANTAPAQPANVPPARSFIQELKVRMCAITEHPDFGIRVGLAAQASPGSAEQRSYYMRIGETQGGITLVDADVEEEAALLKHGSEEVWLSMREGAVNLNAASGPAAGAAADQADAAAAGRMSYAERLRQRREMRRQHQEEKKQPQLTGEDLERHLKEYQMELIRAGGALGPPLPIPLTKEMDDQLVAEGILPPAAE